MRIVGRGAAVWACVALLAAFGCSSKKSGGGQVLAGGGPFGNAPQGSGGSKSGSKAGAGSTKTGTGSTSGAVAGNGALLNNGQCAEGVAHGGHTTPRIVLVVDGSCSMSSDYPSTGRDATQCQPNPNGRWAAIKSALIDPQNGVVTNLQTGVEFGLVVFGTQPMCPIPGTPVQPALNNLPAIMMALPNVQPGMYTPTGPALDWVYSNMFPNASASPDKQTQPQIAILATDGEPNACDNATPNFQPSIDAVTKGAMMGVKTYVISLAAGNGQFHDHLQQLANLGVNAAAGTNAMLYEPTTPQALSDFIEQLVGGAVGCDLPLNGRVTQGAECGGMVELNGMPLKCNDPNGWILADPSHVRLQGTACDTLKKSPDATLDAQFSCDIIHVQ